MAVTCYDLVGNESDLSDIINFSINPPGLAGESVLDGSQPAMGVKKRSREILFSVFKKSDSTDSNVPRDLTVRLLQ